MYSWLCAASVGVSTVQGPVIGGFGGCGAPLVFCAWFTCSLFMAQRWKFVHFACGEALWSWGGAVFIFDTEADLCVLVASVPWLSTHAVPFVESACGVALWA